MRIEFTSKLSVKQRENLEKLLFFNEMQCKIYKSIEKSVDKFGVPQIVDNNGSLRVEIKPLHSQSIFAFDHEHDAVVGFVMFISDRPSTLLILHIAVLSEFSFKGKNAHLNLTFKLIDEVIAIARKIGKKQVKIGDRHGSNVIALNV